jgi:hypothetical protein
VDNDCDRMRAALATIEQRAEAALADWLKAGPSGLHEALEAIRELAKASRRARGESP